MKNIAFTGLDGMDKMKEIMAGLREKPVAAVGGLAVQHARRTIFRRKRTDADRTRVGY
ncbi:MAG: hypothetical protein M0C28_09270 [Candidatus Moduliflexus flocculans]|nr:hypothetical protein [Candidatus Moduliflexus flocculans]